MVIIMKNVSIHNAININAKYIENDIDNGFLTGENTGCTFAKNNTIAVIAEAIIPCNAFPKIYGFRLSPLSAVTDITCRCTLNPENPTINDVRISFSVISSRSNEILSTPVENSHSPVAIALSIGEMGSNSNSVRAIAEKNITEKHTVRMFLDEASSASVIALEIGTSFVFIRVGGEVCFPLP